MPSSKLACLAALLAALSACSKSHEATRGSAAPGGVSPPAYALEDTEVRMLHAPSLGRDYPIYVSVPAAYRQQPGHRFPVVFVTDAPYGFPLLRSIVRRLGGQNAEIEDPVIVGLGYARGDTPEYSRRRDYTPTPDANRAEVSDMPERPSKYGEALGYRRFLAETVLPFVARTYRVDMGRKIYVGHSYGALLGADILLSRPDMFEHYLISSPSLWYGHRAMFAHEQAYARTHRDLAQRDLKADVYISAGGLETVRPGSPDQRYNDRTDMAGDAQVFARALASRRYPNLHVTTEILPGEDHLTVAPISFTHGLMRVLGVRAEWRSQP